MKVECIKTIVNFYNDIIFKKGKFYEFEIYKAIPPLFPQISYKILGGNRNTRIYPESLFKKYFKINLKKKIG